MESATVAFVVDVEKALFLDGTKIDSVVHFAGTSLLTVDVEPRSVISPLLPAPEISVLVCFNVLVAFIFCWHATCRTVVFCLFFGGTAAVKVFVDVRRRLNKALKRLARVDADSDIFFFGANDTCGTFTLSEDLQFSIFVLVIKACKIIQFLFGVT